MKLSKTLNLALVLIGLGNIPEAYSSVNQICDNSCDPIKCCSAYNNGFRDALVAVRGIIDKKGNLTANLESFINLNAGRNFCTGSFRTQPHLHLPQNKPILKKK